MFFLPAKRPRHTPSPADCRAALDRVLASRTFQRSERHRRFLSFVVSEALQGHQSAIKETVLAAEVFDRDSSFDQQVDSIVRVEARKLRQRLREYSDDEGRADPIRIEIPKGSYVPVFQQLATRPARRFARYGLPGIALVVLTLAGLGYWRYGRGGPATVYSTVAVLPFSTPDSDAALAALADGLSGDVTAGLAGVPGLRVAPRQVTRVARAPGATVAELAHRLNVDTAVEGEVSRLRDGIRIHVAVHSAAGRVLWSGHWDREDAAAPLVDRDIAHSVAAALGHSVPATTSALRPATARRLYWTARYLRERSGPAERYRAVEAFRQVVNADPAYAPAWAGLAEACTDIAFHRAPESAGAIVEARMAAGKALALDPSQAGAYASLARIHFFHDWNWPAAETGFQRALVADPQSAAIHREFSLALAARRRFDDALAHARKAAELDPLADVSSYDSGLILFMSGNYDGCIETMRQAASVNSASYAVLALLGTCLTSAGRPGEALEPYRQARSLAPERRFILARLAAASARAGDRRQARDLLRQLLEPQSPGFSWIHPAYVHAALDQRASAIDCLERAAQVRDPDFVFIGAEPLFRPLAADPRFRALLKRLAL